MSTAVCRACRYPAVPSAAICLHCGTPNPVTIGRSGMAVSLFAGVLVFAVILAVLFVVL